jgi:hypothetical protein
LYAGYFLSFYVFAAQICVQPRRERLALSVFSRISSTEFQEILGFFAVQEFRCLREI